MNWTDGLDAIKHCCRTSESIRSLLFVFFTSLGPFPSLPIQFNTKTTALCKRQKKITHSHRHGFRTHSLSIKKSKLAIIILEYVFAWHAPVLFLFLVFALLYTFENQLSRHFKIVFYAIVIIIVHTNDFAQIRFDIISCIVDVKIYFICPVSKIYSNIWIMPLIVSHFCYPFVVWWVFFCVYCWLFAHKLTKNTRYEMSMFPWFFLRFTIQNGLFITFIIIPFDSQLIF